nr:aldehyde dehydrogenase [Fodinibius sp.]NIV15400.1 aldehyde dehydrogenase [Fodinibius sp.]NIY25954.1 aldehyde dehydrogenase [Fodinibius sp.]
EQEQRKQIDENATLNLKRVRRKPIEDWESEEAQSPYYITDFQETKTTWHPVGL